MALVFSDVIILTFLGGLAGKEASCNEVNKSLHKGRMMEKAEQLKPEEEAEVVQRAKDRARAARWDLNIAIFLFAVLIIIMILLYQGIGVEIVAPVALFGLSMVWYVGSRQGKQLYRRFYAEERLRLEGELKQKVAGTVKEAIQETVEEQVQKALRERWQR